ncbi:glycosyltransferase family 4 protein [Flammeovirgaceae bacterium SG7u.111]|nr:glycosyltransferase family 4 protein [Flammeovirgaceae bacterium SG7u.132]WPO37529.1 glycosyltransferase family 4 protein [Flammeovirgaceae bacterium SG7u.111]
MKILFFTHYSKMLGANRSMINLIEGLKEKGISCTVFCPNHDELVDACEKIGVTCKVLPFHNDVYFMKGLSRAKGLIRHFKNSLAINRIEKEVKVEAPDIIHTNTSAVFMGAKIAKKLGVPHIWHIREFGMEDYQMKHNLGSQYFFNLLNTSRHIICISKAIKQHFSTQLKAPSSIIYNGVLWEKEMKPAPSPQSNPIVNFLIIGALKPEKGQMEAITAFTKVYQRNPNCALTIVGDSPDNYMEVLKKQAKKLGVSEQVNFTGYTSNPSLYYETADCLLMCSKNEGMGRVTVEAMANGVPVIGYNGGATPELVEEGRNGFLYKNEEELVEKMMFCMNNPSAKIELGKNGIALAKEQFSIEKYAEKALKIYNHVLS